MRKFKAFEWMPMLCLALLLSGLACGGSGNDDDDDDDDDTSSGYYWDREKLTENGHFMLYIAAIPDPIPFNDLFKLSIMVHDGEQNNLMYDDATLEIDARMPAHNHGMTTQPVITREPSGTFTVEGMQFHMAGDWELVLVAARNGVSDRAVIDIKCCEP